MVVAKHPRDHRRSVDEVFDYLHAEISALKLKPGDKISEAEIAAHFGVSRQPVRDAFSRLENQGLLLIRPQRATEVKRFSSREIEKARFVRSAIEMEVLRRASAKCQPHHKALLDACLADQEEIVAANDYRKFGELDYVFHKSICDIADADYAFDVISAEKAKVDRLCVLSHKKETRLPMLLEDHKAIAEAIISGDEDAAVDAGKLHLSRLDETIETIFATNSNYFEQDVT